MGTRSHGSEFLDHDARKALVWHAMDGRANSFLNGANRAFNLRNVIFCRADREVDGRKARLESMEFTVGMDVGYGKTALCVEINVGLDAGSQVLLGPFRNGTAG